MESYLEPGFDPNSLKVAELRGVLLKHDVDYPSSAKKSLLVELFNQHIVPEAARLRSANTLVQPSSHGMIDAGFTPEKSVLDPTPRRNRRSTRGLTAELTTEDDDERNFLKSTTARTPRKRAADGESASNENIPPPPSTARRTRKSMAIQPDENPAEADNFADEISPTVQDVPFSSFNPFQKGSPSPPFDARSPYKDRRKTTGTPSTVSKHSTSFRRRTEGGVHHLDVADQSGGMLKNRRQSSRAPAYDNGMAENEGPADELEPGEEFEPQDAVEFAKQPARDLVRLAPRRSARSNKSGNALVLILLFMAIAYAMWWRKEKIAAGYCGVGGLEMQERDTEGSLADLLRPECEPCPPHARCYPEMELECVDDYIKVYSYASLGGLYPIPPTCVPDTEKERRVMIMSDAALNILRQNGAEKRCKEKFLSGDLELDSVSEADLRRLCQMESSQNSGDLL